VTTIQTKYPILFFRRNNEPRDATAINAVVSQDRQNPIIKSNQEYNEDEDDDEENTRIWS